MSIHASKRFPVLGTHFVCVPWLLVGCGATAHQVRALEVGDAINAAVCDAVIGANGTGAQIDELEVAVGLTTAARVEAGVNVEVLAVTAEASVELASTVTVHFSRETLPPYERCLALRGEPMEAFQLSVVDGQATILSAPGDESPVVDLTTTSLGTDARPVRGRVAEGACSPGTVSALNPDATEPNRERCVHSYEAGSTVRLLPAQGDRLRWRVTDGHATECQCVSATSQTPPP